MPIINYESLAEKAKEDVLNNKKISDKNKNILKKFLNAYDVSPAREAIFLKHIKLLLERTPDIEKDMYDSDKINKIFKELRKNISSSYYATIINVSLRFVRWVNNDDENKKPKGFKDIKNVPKAKQRRDLNPKDMITWDDSKKLISHTTSIQIKAALQTQLDAGFRPSEFIDLNYGDIEIKDDLVIFNVKGKTGKRNVWIHRAVPAFLRWYDNHPTKKKDHPLWTLENVKKSHSKEEKKGNIRRYTYKSIQKRFELLKEKAGLDKPIDFYNLRHSSCVLDKKDNVPEELAAERHGHSIEHYTKTYGRLSVEDTLKRVRNHYGEPEEKIELVKNQKCSRCQSINNPEAEFCRVCAVPLTVEQAAKTMQEKERVDNKLNEMESILKAIVNSNPKLVKALKEINQTG